MSSPAGYHANGGAGSGSGGLSMGGPSAGAAAAAAAAAAAGSDGGPNAPAQQSTKELLSAALQARVASNNYIAHLKIWETVTEGGQGPARKARYLILAVQRDSGRVTINKAKRNANGSFSIGKDWDLNTLREVVVDQPDHFTLSLARSYGWQTERGREQTFFLQTLVKVYRKYTGDSGPRIVGLDMPQQPSSNGDTSASAGLSPPSGGQRKLPQIDTAIERQRSRESPMSASGSAQSKARSASRSETASADRAPAQPASDGYTIPTISTTLAPDTAEDNLTPKSARFGSINRRPSINRQVSANAVLTPAVDEDVQNRSITPPPSIPASISQGNSPSSAARALHGKNSEASSPVLARSPSRVADKLQAVVHQQGLQSPPSNGASDVPLSTSAFQPARQHRRPSGDSASSLSVTGSGGDARARLSSIEPVRGGAAYEKMLLAGTGLSGVSEGDEGEEGDETTVDPYGGADFTETEAPNGSDALAESRRKQSTKRRNRDAQDLASMQRDNTGEDDDVDTTLMHVEEMLEGFEFRHNMANNISARKGTEMTGKGTADIIEARLLDELAALDAANIHAIIESDDRVNFVVQHMEQSLRQLDMIDSMIAGYKMQLNARAEDISHIESQNLGLQVQTSNQRALSTEIDKLLSTVNVDDTAVDTLLHIELDSDEGIGQLEAASAALYKAMLQAKRTQDDTRGGDPNATGLAAATERLEEYNSIADRFARRMLEYLTEAFNQQTYAILHDPARLKALAPPNPTILEQSVVEVVLGRYCGLLLYAKEVSPSYFSRISAAYFASASERYRGEMSTLFSVSRQQIASVSNDEAAEASFTPPPSQAAALRSGTIRRAGRGDRSGKTFKSATGEVSGSEAFARVLNVITPLVAKEQTFISDLLHINNNAITFADYMELEVFFQRRAADIFGGSASLQGPLKSMKDAMELIFGFMAPEWQQFVDHVLSRDKMQVIGMLAALDRAVIDAEELNNDFLTRSFNKLQGRLAQQLERFVAEQIRAIEQTKLTAKKRKGVAHFIKVFPLFVERIEAQLVNAETLPIRTAVDNHYDHICSTMFDALQTMAIPKMEGGTFHTSNVDEDKGLLNHHVIVIENMFHFVKEVNRTKAGQSALAPQLKRAQAMLDEALHAYVQTALRRPLGKMMDFGDGIDSLLRSTPANEVHLHSAYSRQAAKRLVKEYSSKDIRKAIEALSRRAQKHFDEEDLTTLVGGVGHDGGGGGAAGGSAQGGGAGPGGGGLGGGGMQLHDTSGISADEIAEVLAMVWRHLEDGFSGECERMVRILRECYSNDSKLLADFTTEDVRRPFASNAPAGRRR